MGVYSFGDCCSYGHEGYYTRIGGDNYDWISGVLRGGSEGEYEAKEICSRLSGSDGDGGDDKPELTC